MRIAVDVMGGDHGCGVVIEGAQRALQADKRISALFLVGNKSDIHAALPQGGFRDHRMKVVHASEVLTMDDKPVAAVRKKKDCSLIRAIELVHDGKADAVISLGNTGGIFAAATFRLGRIAGVDRGGIATIIPTPDHHFVLLDAGANIECKPVHLAHYAIMGSIYSREILGRSEERRVGKECTG
jgi:phosphate acyltransferase